MNKNSHCNTKMGGTSVPPKKLKGLLKLLISILIIIIFIRVASFSENLPFIKNEFKALRDRGIQTGLFWWADVQEVAEAEKHFKRLNLIRQSSNELSKSEKSSIPQNVEKEK